MYREPTFHPQHEGSPELVLVGWVQGFDISIELRRPWREGNTRLHSEPGSQASQRRWYCTGDGVGE
jgi:hypothetical protein